MLDNNIVEHTKFVEKQIFGFEIAVSDALPVQILDTSNQLPEIKMRQFLVNANIGFYAQEMNVKNDTQSCSRKILSKSSPPAANSITMK